VNRSCSRCNTPEDIASEITIFFEKKKESSGALKPEEHSPSIGNMGAKRKKKGKNFEASKTLFQRQSYNKIKVCRVIRQRLTP
jgi:hypothetical protein